MGSVFPRHNKLSIKFKLEGRWITRSTPFHVGEERAAKRLLEEVERQIDAGVQLGALDLGELTVACFASRFIDWCKESIDGQIRIRDWKNYRGILSLWILPIIGPIPLANVRRKHIKAVTDTARTSVSGRGKPLSSSRVHNIYGVAQSLFKRAVAAELIDHTPCTLDPRHDLPPKGDSDPEWRASAKYSREEIEQLTSDPRIPHDRRVLYAIEFYGRCRHGEAAGLLWRHWLREREPLGGLLLRTSYGSGRTKTGVPREMPVHSSLEMVLRQWWAEGWERIMGRAPTEHDLIVPAPPEEQARRRSRQGEMRMADLSRDRLAQDLKLLCLRYRRGHDLGTTFITLAREDGARGDILKHSTHGKPRTIIEQYSRFSWATYCAEVMKLKMKRRWGGQLISLPVAIVAGAKNRAGEPIDPLFGTDVGTVGDQSLTITAGNVASPTGFEPVSPA